jgi:iron complex outermembrane receptor protein
LRHKQSKINQVQMKKGFILLISLFLALNIFANDPPLDGTGSIRGTVTTSDGKAAPEVTVLIKGTAKGTVTDESGVFEFRKIKQGNYTLQFSHLGFATVEEDVVVEEGKQAEAAIQLNVSNKELTAVIVTSNKKFRTGWLSPSLRLTSPIIETPQNIQVITKGIINDQQSFDMLEGIQRNVSGAQKLEHWDNYALINMRGSYLTAFRNGLNVAMPWGPLTEDMSMVDRIEFVKGPAGFMLSNGEPGGFYNVVTKKPSGNNKGEVSFSLGSFDLFRSTLDLDGKLSKDGKLLYRLNLMGQLKGSHRDFEYNNRYSIVPVLKYLVDDKTAVTLEFTHQFSEMSVIGSNYSFSNRKYGDLPRKFTTAEPNLDPSKINDNSVQVFLEHRFNDDWKFTAQAGFLKYDLVGQSLWPWSISSGNDSLMQRGISIWDALALNKTGQMFLNGQIVSGAVTHKVLFGVDMGNKDYYADWNQGAALGDSNFNIYQPVYGTIAAGDIPQWDRSKSIRERGVRYNNSYSSFYAQDEIELFNNRMRLTLAGRFTTNKNVDAYSGTTDDNKFTPRLGLSYSIDKSTSAYFVYDESFVANYGTNWQGKSFDPLTGVNLEAGLKKDWFNGKWNSTVSVYQITRNNVLTTDLEHPNPNTGQFTYQRQTGQQRTKGVEVDVKGEITRNLEAVVNYAFTEAKVTKDTDPKIVGNQVAGATKHIQNTWLSYKIRDGLLSGLRFSLGYQYQSGRSSWYIFDNSENSLPDYFRLDGGISYQTSKFDVNFNVNNITNKYLYSGAPYGSMIYWQTEPGINTRLSVFYKF